MYSSILSILLAVSVAASPLAEPPCPEDYEPAPSSAIPYNATDKASSPSIPAVAAVASSAVAPDAFIASAWFTGWHATSNPAFTVADISWEKYTHMVYAFATTTPDVKVLGITDDDERIIQEFVSAAHKNHVKVSISVGGWTGSRYFSTAVATAENRTAFVKTLSDFVTKHEFDGIDIDWEAPGKQGVGCNIISQSDTANFFLLLQELRSTPSTSHLILSAATGITPFIDASGKPSSSVVEFAGVLDYISIMAYDIWGKWSNAVGPNAPLDDACAPSANRQGSAKSAVAAWTDAGFPKSQIVLGVASYGHSYSVDKSTALNNGALVPYPSFDANNQPAGDSWDGGAGLDVCGVQQPAGGVFNYRGLVQENFLTSAGAPSPGIERRFDNCSQTPYVYNPTSGVLISFDDADSFRAKGKFITETGLRGFAMWEAGGDFQNTLLDAIREGALGKS